MDEWSAWRRDLYWQHTYNRPLLTTHLQQTSTDNTQQPQEREIHNPAGFEPTIPWNERLQTHTLDRAATGIGYATVTLNKILYSRQFGIIQGTKLTNGNSVWHPKPVTSCRNPQH
jgi:hypothetical protein